LIPALLGKGVQYQDGSGRTWVFRASKLGAKARPEERKIEVSALPRRGRALLTSAQKQEIRDLRREGKLSWRELAARYGVSHHTVWRALRSKTETRAKAGSQKVVKVNFQDKRRRRKTRLLTEEVKAKIRALLKKGYKIDQAAKKTGHTWRTVKALA
jgi:DNA-binding transcriptional regulator YhcF (GntR family)